MDYDKFLDNVQNLDFIPNRETADAATKAVLGILVSRLPEEQVREMSGKLPEPLTLERLRGMQKYIENISFERYVTDIANEFWFDHEQAQLLISIVLGIAREAMGEETSSRLQERLPADWAGGLNRAVSPAAAQAE
jgi:uncharacterized protein (DUF2267 family)